MPDIRQSLDQLREEWSTCQRCPLGEHRVASQGKFVFGEGSTGGIMFIGEGPGRNEETCLVPETLVLMADLSWKTLDKVEIGDRVMSLDADAPPAPGISRTGPRRWRVAAVTNKVWHRAETWRVTATTGELIGSGDHRVLTGKGCAVRWQRLDYASSGSKRATRFYSIGPVWSRLDTYEAGWLSGFLDGEGHITGSKGGRRSHAGCVGYSQNVGPIEERAEAVFNALGVPLRGREEQRTKGVACARRHIRGGPVVGMRLLGRIRPERLITDFTKVIEGKSSRGLIRSKVLGRERAGERDVIDITTTSGTFIANGFVVHNCGRPFVGKSGKLLRGILNKYQFRHWYISNVVACRSCEQQRDAAGLPIFNERRGVKLPRIVDVTPPPQSLAACLPRLYEEIYRVDPVVIVTLGLPAAETLLKKTVRITKDAGNAQHLTIPGSAWVPELTDKKGAWTRKVHGQWVSPISQNEVRYLVIPTIHPAYVLRKLKDGDSRSPLQELAKHIGLAIKTYERYMLEVFGMIPEAPAAQVGDDWIEEYRAELEDDE